MFEWTHCQLTDVCDFFIGGTPSRNQPEFWATPPEGAPWLAISDLKSKFLWGTKEHITKLGALSSNVKVVPSESTVMSFKLSIGRVGITKTPMYCNEAIVFFKPFRGRLDSRWIYHAIPRATNKVVTDSAVKGATLNKKKIAEIPLDLPPLNEQLAIAKVLDTLDTQIHKTEALIAKLEKVKEGLLHDLLTRGIDENGRLRPSSQQAPELYKESPLGLIPSEWLITEIVSICKLGRGRVISQSYLEAYPGPYPVYSSQTKNGGVFGRIDSFDFEGPHVTWTTDGANAGTVTYREGRFNCTNVCGTLEARDETIHMPFLAWALDRLTDRYVSRVGNDKLMNNVVAKMQVQIPSKHEQVRCTKSLEPIEKRVQHETRSLIKLKAQKTALMDDLLTGRVRVTPLLDQATTPA